MKCSRKALCIICALASWSSAAALAAEAPSTELPASLAPATQLATLIGTQPSDDAALHTLARTAEQLLAAVTEPAGSAELRRSASPIEMSAESAGSTQSNGSPDDPDGITRNELRGAKAILRLSRHAIAATAPENRAADVWAIRELQSALWNGRQPTVPPRLGPISTWVVIAKNLRRPIGEGTRPALNLPRPVGPAGDGGRTDPLPSTFWQRPAEIRGQDLGAGFGRAELPRFSDAVLLYDKPKTSSGTHPGFHALLGGRECRIKFGEINSEPFTARIFAALGYHVDPTDYAAGLRVRYDRRILLEFNRRRSMKIRITPLGFALISIELQPYKDPFEYILAAQLKNGQQITTADLKLRLLRDPARSYPETSADNFRAEVESSLKYLILVPANIQFRAGPAHNVGPWGFGDLDHANRREVRGLALLAAWLGWFDSRTDNTKLRVDSHDGSVRLEHFLSDLGSGMGSGTGWVSQHGEDPNALTWTFTRPEIVRGPGRMTTPFRIRSFKPTVPTAAFRDMTPDDARWMARLIGQLSEDQLRAALVASGYDSAQAALYLEKLVSRRDQMVRDLQLTGEIALLRPGGTDRRFSYEPRVDGLFQARLSSGTVITARDAPSRIIRGKLVN